MGTVHIPTKTMRQTLSDSVGRRSLVPASLPRSQRGVPPPHAALASAPAAALAGLAPSLLDQGQPCTLRASFEQLQRQQQQQQPVSTSWLPAPVADAWLPSQPAAHATVPSPPATLPAELTRLLDPSAPVRLPRSLPLDRSHGKLLDKLVSQLGRSKATWRRALVLYEWLKASGNRRLMDARLCTTLIRVCGTHHDTVSALALYEWMRAPASAGGAGLLPSVFTYTEVMRAALNSEMVDKCTQVWDDARAAHVVPDSHLCIAYMEACIRLRQTDRALAVYERMRSAPAGSTMAPSSAHAYTVAMKAACEGGHWGRAMDIWGEMEAAGCPPTAQAYTAAIRACAGGCDWPRAVALFRDMSVSGIQPDVVACTALIKALASTGEADKAEAVVQWMRGQGMAPNVTTYTVLMMALSNAQQWGRALELLYKMQLPEWGQVQPNAYTYSVLIKQLGDHGQWQLAEAVFGHAEQVALAGNNGGASSGAALSPMTGGASQRQLQAPAVQPEFPSGSSSSSMATPEAGQVDAAAAATMSSTGAAAGAAAAAGDGAWVRSSQLNGISIDLAGQGVALAGQQEGAASAAAPSTATVAFPSGSSANGSASSVSAVGRGFSLFSHPSMAPPQAPPTPLMQRPSHHSHGGAAVAAGDGTAGSSSQRSQAFNPGPFSLVESASSKSLLLREPGPSTEEGPSDAGTAVAGGPPGYPNQPTESSAPVVNVVVCGALMHAYERAGMWAEALGVLGRARALGLQPNLVMLNTAIAAAGKAGQVELCKQLFGLVAKPDLITYETMINAFGYSGQPRGAEHVFAAMQQAGFTPPRDYAWCGLIAAYSLAGDVDSALAVRRRAKRAAASTSAAPSASGGSSGSGEAVLSVNVYNALLAACERARRVDDALALLAEMKRLGLAPDAVTSQLMGEVGRQGVASVEGQQAALAAVSAAMAAAGGLLIQRGLF